MIRVDSSVSEEWPMHSKAVCFPQIQFYNFSFFLVVRCQIKQFTLPIGYKASTPELHGAVLLIAYAVYTYHRNTICYGMTPLNSLPSIVLVFVGFFILFGSPTNSSRVEQNLGTHERCDSCCFWIPLIPAY